MLKTLTLRERANCYALSRSLPPPSLSLAPSTPSPSHRGREVNKSMTDDFMSCIIARRAQFRRALERERNGRENYDAMHQFGFFDDDIACTGSETDGIPMAPKNKENSKRKKQMEDEGDEDYRKRRDRNNQAVKRSRVKSKLRTQQTLERVNQLKTENELLEEKIKMLTKELGFLKDLFLAHAGGSSQQSINIQDLDLNTLLAVDKPTEDSPKSTSKP